jgi:hypothetical protein
MAPIHSHEYLVFERLQERQHEQAQRRRLSQLGQSHLRRVQHLVSRLGTFFVAIGTKLQQVEQRGEHTV